MGLRRPPGGHPAAKPIFERFRAPFWLHFGSQKSPKNKLNFEQNSGSDFYDEFWPSGGLRGRFRLEF